MFLLQFLKMFAWNILITLLNNMVILINHHLRGCFYGKCLTHKMIRKTLEEKQSNKRIGIAVLATHSALDFYSNLVISSDASSMSYSLVSHPELESSVFQKNVFILGWDKQFRKCPTAHLKQEQRYLVWNDLSAEYEIMRPDICTYQFYRNILYSQL